MPGRWCLVPDVSGVRLWVEHGQGGGAQAGRMGRGAGEWIEDASMDESESESDSQRRETLLDGRGAWLRP